MEDGEAQVFSKGLFLLNVKGFCTLVPNLPLAVFGEMILDLARLTFCPDRSLHRRRVKAITLQLYMSVLAKRVRSSAKNRWERLSPDLQILIGSQSL